MSFFTHDFNLLEADSSFIDTSAINLAESTHINMEMELGFANLREATILSEYHAEMQAIKESSGLSLTESARETLIEASDTGAKSFFAKAKEMILKAWANIKSFFSRVWDKIVTMVQSDKKWLARPEVQTKLAGFNGSVSVTTFPKVASADTSGISAVEKALPSLMNSKIDANDYVNQINTIRGKLAGSKDVKGDLASAMSDHFLGGKASETTVSGSSVQKLYKSASNILRAAENVKSLNKLLVAKETLVNGEVGKLAVQVAKSDGVEGEGLKNARKSVEKARAETALFNQALSGATQVINTYRKHTMTVLKKAMGSESSAGKSKSDSSSSAPKQLGSEAEVEQKKLESLEEAFNFDFL